MYLIFIVAHPQFVSDDFIMLDKMATILQAMGLLIGSGSQHFSMRVAYAPYSSGTSGICGLVPAITASAISPMKRRLDMKPSLVRSSQRITPREYTSDFVVQSSLLSTSGAVQMGFSTASSFDCDSHFPESPKSHKMAFGTPPSSSPLFGYFN